MPVALAAFIENRERYGTPACFACQRPITNAWTAYDHSSPNRTGIKLSGTCHGEADSIVIGYRQLQLTPRPFDVVLFQPSDAQVDLAASRFAVSMEPGIAIDRHLAERFREQQAIREQSFFAGTVATPSHAPSLTFAQLQRTQRELLSQQEEPSLRTLTLRNAFANFPRGIVIGAPHCLRCNGPVTDIQVTRNYMDRSFLLFMRCHGEQASYEIEERILLGATPSSPFRLSDIRAFAAAEPSTGRYEMIDVTTHDDHARRFIPSPYWDTSPIVPALPLNFLPAHERRPAPGRSAPPAVPDDKPAVIVPDLRPKRKYNL